MQYKNIFAGVPLRCEPEHGMETIPYRGTQLWKLMPENIKFKLTSKLFKNKISQWKCEHHPYRMGKTYLQHNGVSFTKSSAFNLANDL